MDRYVYACLALVFLAFLEALVTARLSADPAKKELGLRIDRWSRILFPLAYLALVIQAWVG